MNTLLATISESFAVSDIARITQAIAAAALT
jgi:hypothetical protein